MADAGLKEFVSAYVVEAEEHLELASAQLLAVDAALRAGGANLKGVREAFRALHTVKGLSAMVGVEPVVAITHRMETILRVHDRRASKLPLNVVDTLPVNTQSWSYRIATGADLGAADFRRVVDYQRLVELAREVVAGGHVLLVETLAERIAAAALTDHRVERARVTVEKPEAFPDVAGVGVMVERRSQQKDL